MFSYNYCEVLHNSVYLVATLNCYIILQKQLMIVGIDVYHDSTFGQKKSVVGFVASTNRYVLFILQNRCSITHLVAPISVKFHYVRYCIPHFLKIQPHSESCSSCLQHQPFLSSVNFITLCTKYRISSKSRCGRSLINFQGLV